MNNNDLDANRLNSLSAKLSGLILQEQPRSFRDQAEKLKFLQNLRNRRNRPRQIWLDEPVSELTVREPKIARAQASKKRMGKVKSRQSTSTSGSATITEQMQTDKQLRASVSGVDHETTGRGLTTGPALVGNIAAVQPLPPATEPALEKRIPEDKRTKAMSKKEALNYITWPKYCETIRQARYWLNQRIKDGEYECEPTKSRKMFIFNVDDFPDKARQELSKK